MSCRDGERCDEGRKRLRALLVLGVMLVAFIVLSAFSFLGSRGQVTPNQFKFANFPADDGKHVFQSYNCMGCHTMVGNGAYFGPDLTEEYRKAGPAWLAAFLPSAGGWPTEAALKVQLANAVIAADAGTASLDEYYAKFPGARERVARRTGATLMPNLPLTHDEVEKLIAYLKYTSAIDTEGWPPKVESGSLEHRLELAHRPTLLPVMAAAAAAPVAAPAAATAAETPADPAAHGQALATQFACNACHSTGTQRLVGPGWGGLYGSQVKLADGSTVTADDAYLAESILHPDAKVVDGFPKGTMPNYSGQLTDADVTALVAYLRSLEKPR
jgi:mono/diheme cytochrome c family protein